MCFSVSLGSSSMSTDDGNQYTLSNALRSDNFRDNREWERCEKESSEPSIRKKSKQSWSRCKNRARVFDSSRVEARKIFREWIMGLFVGADKVQIAVNWSRANSRSPLKRYQVSKSLNQSKLLPNFLVFKVQTCVAHVVTEESLWE